MPTARGKTADDVGIHDRDYMRRRRDDDSDREGSTASDLEEFLTGFLQRHPRLPMIAIATLVALVIVIILAVKFSGKGG